MQWNLWTLTNSHCTPSGRSQLCMMQFPISKMYVLFLSLTLKMNEILQKFFQYFSHIRIQCLSILKICIRLFLAFLSFSLQYGSIVAIPSLNCPKPGFIHFRICKWYKTFFRLQIYSFSFISSTITRVRISQRNLAKTKFKRQFFNDIEN